MQPTDHGLIAVFVTTAEHVNQLAHLMLRVGLRDNEVAISRDRDVERIRETLKVLSDADQPGVPRISAEEGRK